MERRRSAEKQKSLSRRKRLQQALQAAVAAASLSGAVAAEELRLPPGVKKANDTISESVHKKAAARIQRAAMEDLPSHAEILRMQSKMFKAHFAQHPHMTDGVDPQGLRTILSQMQSLSKQSVKGTEYDFRGMPAGQANLDSPEGAHGNGIALRFYEENPDSPGLKERFVMVTVKHVADLVPSPNGKRWTHHPTSDVSVVELSREEAILYTPLFLSRTHANDDLSGEVVAVLGMDIDAKDGKRVTIEKQFPAVYSPRLTPEVFSSMTDRDDPMIIPLNGNGKEDWAEAGRMRLIVLPPEETEPDPIAKGKPAVAGMSGSPLVYLPKGGRGVEFAGLLSAAAHAKIDGKAFSLGFVIDQQLVWEAIRRLPKDGEAPEEEEPQTERPPEGASDDWLSWAKKQF